MGGKPTRPSGAPGGKYSELAVQQVAIVPGTNGYSPGRDTFGASRKGHEVYEPENAKENIDTFERHLLRHAVITWVIVPLFAACQEWIGPLQPTCEYGYRDATLVVVLLIELHRIYSERSAWHLAKGLISPPEVSVLRRFGVLARRRRLVLLGIIESVDLYTDLTFPWIARDCGGLTEPWNTSWAEVPYFGMYAVKLLDVIRFWGCCLICAALNVLIAGGMGLAGIYQSVQQRRAQLKSLENSINTGCPRIGGEVWFGWAMSSSTAMMPSLVSLCEAMADQNKYLFDEKFDERKGLGHGEDEFRGATKAREDVIWGKIDKASVQEYELQNPEEQDRVTRAGHWHYVRLLLVKVFVGNMLSLYLQSSFLALKWGDLEVEARAKIIASLVISALLALFRCVSVTAKTGLLGCGLSVVILFWIAWTALKLYMAIKCAEHVWNLTTWSCVDI